MLESDHDARWGEGCGVFGIFGHPDAARLTYYGLFALQHRGQESAGIATSDRGEIRHLKGMGLVADVFTPDNLSRLPGNIAIGHVRYSTTGRSLIENAQPLVVRYRGGMLAVAHNGNLTNALQMRQELAARGAVFQTTTDTEMVAHLAARYAGADGHKDVVAAIRRAFQDVQGAYAMVLMTEDRLIGVRDPHGIRPLSLGRLGDAWVLASESCAFDAIGAEMVRDVAPGEMVVVDRAGLHSLAVAPAARPALCLFEFVYLARPDSNLAGVNVHMARKALGRRLARDWPVEADLVAGVPDSGIAAAAGYAEEAGIPYEVALVKNRYIGRTFIQPTESDRLEALHVKLNALRKVVDGKRVVLVDDSIVRGVTSRHTVRLLRAAGAQEVHLRISSAPYRWPCFYGIDTSRASELVAVGHSIREIEQMVEADSVRYLSVEAMAEAVGLPLSSLCHACFSGEYPVPVDPAQAKEVFEYH